MSPENSNGWEAWSKHVLYQLEESTKDRDKLRLEVNKLHDEMLTIKVQSGMIGAIAAGLISWFLKH